MLDTSFESTASGKVAEQNFSLGLVFVSDKAEAEEKTADASQTETLIQPENSPEIGFMGETVQEGQNNNEKILEMHKQGKSTVAIAKELGLGVGEVKLVIDLYKA